jgi:hypothetical protein
LANLPLAFAELMGGGIILDAAIKGDSISNVVRGIATQQPIGGSSSTTGGTTSTGTGAGGTTNPFPGGWVPSRADAGYDGTFSGTQVPGMGVTAALLTSAGIRVFSEDELPEAAAYLAELES